MANCLVLGANGFIGSHLVDSLVAAGHKVRAFDRFGGDSTKFKQHQNIELFTGNFLNRADLDAALIGMEYVFHFISTTTPATAENDPLIDIDTNIKMSIILFEECVTHNIKKVIFASTGGAIYGTDSTEPISEKTLPQPLSPYAIGKLTIENYLRYFNKKHGLESLIFRISNPYGERQALNAKQGVIPIFLELISRDEPVTILGDGSMVRDYIYVTDVASMIVASFETAQQPIYNLGSGHGISVRELVDCMAMIVKRQIHEVHQPVPATFVNKVVLDISQFQAEFKMNPSVDLTAGIQRTWNYVNTGRDIA